MDKFDNFYQGLSDKEKLNLLIHIIKNYINPLQKKPSSIQYITEGLHCGPNAIKEKETCPLCGK